MHQRPAQRVRQVPAAEAVIGVDILIYAARIMKQREEPYDLDISPIRRSDLQSVFPDARPVMDAVIAVQR